MEMSEMGGACRMVKMRGRLVGKPEGKRQIARRRCRCEDNIKMYLQ
jgi:hypothetical protein